MRSDAEDNEQLRRICDQGAKYQRDDPRILPRFCIMPCEIRTVREYMAEHHPGVRYQLEYPTGGNASDSFGK